tara:strand:- start:280 stop:477 length:198 start_codon:yes stop_codon:yes gene_type:complete
METKKESEEKIIKIDDDLSGKYSGEEMDRMKENLDFAVSESKEIKRLVDYFVIGLFLVFIMYVVI